VLPDDAPEPSVAAPGIGLSYAGRRIRDECTPCSGLVGWPEEQC
jgi:hypothetical protein